MNRAVEVSFSGGFVSCNRKPMLSTNSVAVVWPTKIALIMLPT